MYNVLRAPRVLAFSFERIKHKTTKSQKEKERGGSQEKAIRNKISQPGANQLCFQLYFPGWFFSYCRDVFF